MVYQHSISPDHALYIGGVLVSISLIFIVLVLVRFHWFHRFALMRVLLRWGRGNWSYPASKLGALAGGLMILMVGLILMDDYLQVLPQKIWAEIFAALLLFVVYAAIYDYRKYRRSRLYKRRDTYGVCAPPDSRTVY